MDMRSRSNVEVLKNTNVYSSTVKRIFSYMLRLIIINRSHILLAKFDRHS